MMFFILLIFVKKGAAWVQLAICKIKFHLFDIKKLLFLCIQNKLKLWLYFTVETKNLFFFKQKLVQLTILPVSDRSDVLYMMLTVSTL